MHDMTTVTVLKHLTLPAVAGPTTKLRTVHGSAGSRSCSRGGPSGSGRPSTVCPYVPPCAEQSRPARRGRLTRLGLALYHNCVCGGDESYRTLLSATFSVTGCYISSNQRCAPRSGHAPRPLWSCSARSPSSARALAARTRKTRAARMHVHMHIAAARPLPRRS